MNSFLEKYTKQACNRILIEIVKNNDTKALLELLNYNQNLHCDLETKSFNDCTALIIASKHGYTEIVDILLKAGANKDAVDAQQRTALMFASEANHVGVVKLLLQAGANKNAKDIWGKSVLEFGSRFKEIVELLSNTL